MEIGESSPVTVLRDSIGASSSSLDVCFLSRSRHLAVRPRRIADDDKSRVVEITFTPGDLPKVDGLAKIVGGQLQHARTIQIIGEGKPMGYGITMFYKLLPHHQKIELANNVAN